MIKRIVEKSLFKYIVVGVTSLAVDYGLLLIAYRVFGIPLLIATSLAFVVGLTTNFLLNKYWSFQASRGLKQSVKQSVMYAALVAFNLLFTNFLIAFMASISIGPEISKLVVTALITMWNYLLYKYVIFKSISEAPTD